MQENSNFRCGKSTSKNTTQPREVVCFRLLSNSLSKRAHRTFRNMFYYFAQGWDIYSRCLKSLIKHVPVKELTLCGRESCSLSRCVRSHESLQQIKMPLLQAPSTSALNTQNTTYMTRTYTNIYDNSLFESQLCSHRSMYRLLMAFLFLFLQTIVVLVQFILEGAMYWEHFLCQV